MIQSNQHTTPEQRFFFPAYGPIEYHESFDLNGLPRAESLPGRDHYVISRDADGRNIARTLFWGNANLHPGSTITSIEGLSGTPTSHEVLSKWLPEDDFTIFDPAVRYMPSEDTLMMVQAKKEFAPFRNPITHPDYADEKIAILPADQILPSFEDDGVKDDDVRFRLLGFITLGDVLTTWESPNSYDVLLVDWATIDSQANNAVEEALLNTSIPHELSVTGMLSVTPAASGYLHYFDEKYGTSYTPTSDFRWPYRDSRFSNMTTAQRELYLQRVEQSSL